MSMASIVMGDDLSLEGTEEEQGKPGYLILRLIV